MHAGDEPEPAAAGELADLAQDREVVDEAGVAPLAEEVEQLVDGDQEALVGVLSSNTAIIAAKESLVFETRSAGGNL